MRRTRVEGDTGQKPEFIQYQGWNFPASRILADLKDAGFLKEGKSAKAKKGLMLHGKSVDKSIQSSEFMVVLLYAFQRIEGYISPLAKLRHF